MIRDRRRYAELREREELERLRALTVEASIAIGEDLLRSDLMRFVRQAEARPRSLACALRPRSDRAETRRG